MFWGQYYLNQQLVLCCAVFLVFIQAFAAVQMSYAFIHVMYLRFLLRRGLEPVYFSKNYLQLFNYGKNEK